MKQIKEKRNTRTKHTASMLTKQLKCELNNWVEGRKLKLRQQVELNMVKKIEADKKRAELDREQRERVLVSACRHEEMKRLKLLKAQTREYLHLRRVRCRLFLRIILARKVLE